MLSNKSLVCQLVAQQYRFLRKMILLPSIIRSFQAGYEGSIPFSRSKSIASVIARLRERPS